MTQVTSSIYHFNRGIISRLALARVDIKRTAFSAEQMTNWIPRVLGSMMMRPGLQYIGQTNSSDVPRLLPFVFAVDDTALIELCDGHMRVWTNDVLVARNLVGTTVANGNFDTNLTSWIDTDEAGAASTWATGGYMQLVGTGTNAAIRDQTVAVANVDRGVEHALRIVIARGPVTLRVGSTSGGDEYISETDLGTGTHSLAFTPTADFFIRLQSRLERITLVDSCNIEGAGIVTLPIPWVAQDVRLVRADQSGDILFVACKGYQQRKIERRSARSWSVVLYQSDDGPFRTENTGPITIAPSGLSGNVTLTASKAYFKSTQVGGLIRHRSVGQRVSSDISSANTFTNSVRVVGVGEQRRITWQISGTFVATVTLQRSVGTVGFWEDVAQKTGTANESDNDGLDNQVVYYRLGIKAGDYTSGTATCTITYTLGSITGVARITAFTSNLVVDAEVLTDFGSIDASLLWSEGSWSDRRGWPTAVTFYEGRLWWAGKASIWGSVSDAFDSFNPDTEGDAGPINRTIGSGPVDNINWLLPLQRLIAGAPGAEHSVRSTTFDEPLSPTNFNIKEASTQGSASVQAVKIDARGVFVQRSGSRIYELAFDTQAYDYGASDITALVPEICRPGVVAVAVQRQPDTRIHCVLSNGMVAVCVFDRVENVMSWQLMETDGLVEDVAVLPGTEEDSVYYVVNRTVGATGVTALTLTAGGSGYTEVPDVVFTGGGGENASATAVLYPVSVTIQSAGSAYFIGDSLTASNNAVGFSISSLGSRGEILGLRFFGGSGIRSGSVPTNPVTLVGGIGSGATVNLTWGVDAPSLAVTTGGYGFSSAPAVSFTTSDGNGSGAAATATIATPTQRAVSLEKWAKESECTGSTVNKQADSLVLYAGAQTAVTNGILSSLSIIDGFGYATPPSLVFSGGGGTGAAATVSLAFSSIQLASVGSGYSGGDVVTLVGGTYTRPARVEILSVFGTGQVPAIGCVIIDGGSYSVVPAAGALGGPVACTGGTGSGLLFYGLWSLGEATITNPGIGYSSAPTVTLSGGSLTTWGTPAVRAGSITAAITVGTSTSDSTTLVIPNLHHLEGKQVVVWGDGVDLSPDDSDGIQRTYTVTSGTVTLDNAVSQAVVGLPYKATWISTKLANALGQDSALNQRKRISQLGLILVDAHARGLKFGNINGGETPVLDDLPLIEAGAEVDVDTVYGGYDADMIEFPGEWATDNRLLLQAKAPRPCTVLAATMAVEVYEKR